MVLKFSEMLCYFVVPYNSQDLIVYSPLKAVTYFLEVSCNNLVLDQDNNFYLIGLSILIVCLLDNRWIL